MSDLISVKICEGYGCSKKATNCVNVIGGNKGSIILYLCKNCTKLFDDPLKHYGKKTLEQQQVVGPECSNVSHIQPHQQPKGSLDG
jgi:hypothetical protein